MQNLQISQKSRKAVKKKKMANKAKKELKSGKFAKKIQIEYQAKLRRKWILGMLHGQNDLYEYMKEHLFFIFSTLNATCFLLTKNIQ